MRLITSCLDTPISWMTIELFNDDKHPSPQMLRHNSSSEMMTKLNLSELLDCDNESHDELKKADEP